MPYQFYHHRHLFVCRPTFSKKENLSDTDLAVGPFLSVSTVLHAVPRCVACPPWCMMHYASLDALFNCESFVAVVMIGKGQRPEGQTQIRRLVTVGRPNLIHQWVSHREHRSW